MNAEKTDGLKAEKKAERQFAPESSAKKAFARGVEATTTIGKIVVGGGGLFLGIWIWELLSQLEDHKSSAFVAGLAAIGGGGSVLAWGISDIFPAFFPCMKKNQNKKNRRDGNAG